MFDVSWKKLGIAAGLSLSLIVAGCGGQDDTNNNSSEDNNADTTINVSEKVDYTITGIEPGAGISQATNKALEEYENLAGWEHEESSTVAMLTALNMAYENEEPIVIAGWTPHFKFAQYDLKYLEDPEGVYGGEEYIATIVREGLKEDMPEAYTVLERFEWDVEDMESIMLAGQEKDIADAAQEWVDENRDKVDSWIDGVESVDGASIELVLTPWDSERASTNVVRIALEEVGYDVELTPVDPPVMFQAIASGDGDASVAPWMPQTHGDFYSEYEGEFEDLGENLHGAKIGLVVPTYMDIDSIEDLEPAE
ncbi:glycine betaine ABC transporter substrate-binding protein [Ornithinibacillus halophilus]|uniref:Glycine betaine/proline transport system substrate-binding protein n=1 Tax=Ornithinibacillus halophilus TaxID=930117 RepID=A0A1M5LAQ9_9BACI|nr:glycine betaine ABC transporter substrate-binding protein [Ornithinibacillus halophilus]SHG62025.1 glycine betaine/proline transport system substrate-binding protein [Ornithinibacillus halophilus]